MICCIERNRRECADQIWEKSGIVEEFGDMREHLS